MAADTSIEAIRFPRLSMYRPVYEAQLARRNAVEAGTAGEALFLVEHAPTITLGRSSHAEHLLKSRAELAALGVDVVDVNRGGDITYHGPGQAVVYPILRLEPRGLSIRGYLRALEDVLIKTLARYGLRGERLEGYTGVWVNGGKVAAIGVGVHNGVTFHGVALNVAPDMTHFGYIVPCGIEGKPVTSLNALLRNAPTMEQVMQDLEEEFLAYFGRLP